MSNQSSQERISQKLTGDNDKKSKTNIVPIVLAAAVMLVVIVALVLILTKQSPDTEERNVVVTPDNVEEIIADMQKAESGTYEVVMNTTWHFDSGSSASTDAYVENSTANANDVYFDIVRPDTGETIFASPIIPVGSHLENITLDKPLEAGEHKCILTYHLLDDAGEHVSRLDIYVTIVVAG